MSSLKEGMVVIVTTCQAGTIYYLGSDPCVLLANGDFWYGPEHGMRIPQDQADLDAAVLNFDRFKK